MEKIYKTDDKGKKHVVGIRATSRKDGEFIIPVVDVRRGQDARWKANSIIKASSIQQGSKYFRQSFSLMGYSYNKSMKP